MKIRELKAKDVKTLAHILGKLKSSSVSELYMILEGKMSDPLRVGLSVFRIVAADLTDDIYAWLADLIGKKPEELDDMPFGTPAEIIKELVKRGDFKDFFGQAARVAGEASVFSTTSSKSATDGLTKS
jgi:hypothetical protein